MDQRPWWERMFDRDSPVGPVIVVVLLILVFAFVLTVGPILDRLIEGEQPDSYVPGSTDDLARYTAHDDARLNRPLVPAALNAPYGPVDAAERAASVEAHRQGTNAGGQHG